MNWDEKSAINRRIFVKIAIDRWYCGKSPINRDESPLFKKIDDESWLIRDFLSKSRLIVDILENRD